ncbi:MAG: complexin-2 [Clostridia bacterium]
MKNIQISEELFFKLIKFHLFNDYEDAKFIEQEIETKIEKMLKRDYYTKYKTALTAEEREQARQKYLDNIGMKDSFRW